MRQRGVQVPGSSPAAPLVRLDRSPSTSQVDIGEKRIDDRRHRIGTPRELDVGTRLPDSAARLIRSCAYHMVRRRVVRT